jgi:peptidyl-tRNA hydrolase
LKASEEQLKSLLNEPESVHIIDAGKTQIAKDSLTVIGFYPCNNLKEKFKYFKLL